jgi:hypothetical protein
MATAEEAVSAKDPLASALAAGVEVLSNVQTITFTRYHRLILPLDGFAFWVKASIISPSAIYNRMLLNRFGYNAMPKVLTEAPTFDVEGSLHYSSETRQDEPNTYAANRVVFTSLTEVQDLSEVAPDQLWIGEFDGLRFAFSSRSSFYRQADLFHYVGFAVYSDMATQIIDSPIGFSRAQIVSNSLPAWLAINSYFPPYGFGNPGFPLFPSHLVPDNLKPPFAAVHIVPEGTRALGGAPVIATDGSHSQLCADKVRVTLWGLSNDRAMDFMDCFYQYSADVGVLGVMNMPVPRDDKRVQPELLTLSQKKTVDFDVSYNQSTMRNIARQLITAAIPTFIIG